MNSLKLTEPLNLGLTLNSGQVFDWSEKDGFWEGFIHGKKARLSDSGEKLFFEGVEKKEIYDFLKLDENTHEILNKISSKNRDLFLKEMIKKYSGLRILNQEPWECLISFIISQNSSIKTIRKRIETLRGLKGGFPKPGRMASFSEKDFKKMGFGYRSAYLKKTSEIVKGGFDLERLKKISFEDALEELESLPGVGEKVAKCVMLFSLGFNSAFPVDVHIERVMKKRYHVNKNIQEFAVKRFGPYAGYVQQYLFLSDLH